jgi:ankyrin repeat protein
MKSFTLFLCLLLPCAVFAQDGDALITSCLSSDLAAVKTNVENGGNVNYVNAKGQTPLSVSYFSPEVTSYLIGKGADVNGADYPALVGAASFFSDEVIGILLKAGADPNKPGVIKMDVAAPIRKMVEDEKAKGKKANKNLIKAYEDQIAKMPSSALSFSALQNAVRTNCGPCIEQLLRAGAKTDFKNDITGGNLLHEVATTYVSNETRIAGVKSSLPYLEQAGLKVPDWYRDLDAGKFGILDENVKTLIKHGADVEGLDNQKYTPLKAAVVNPTINEDVVNALISNGANLKAAGVTNVKTPFADDTESIDKIKARFDFPREGRNANGGGYSANMDLLNPKPKKVALISYYLYDPGSGKTSGSTFAGSATATAWRTSDYIGQSQIDGFYTKSIDALKAAFKQNGIDVLTPIEFLDTQEKADFYYGFNQESAKKERTEFAIRGKLGTEASLSTLKVSPSGKGYKTFMIANENADESQLENFNGGIFSANRKLTSSLGYELAQGLGVDAVLVVYVCTRKMHPGKDDYGVNAVVTMMLGPNPGKGEDTDPDAKNLGQFYCGTRTFYNKPSVFKVDKGIFSQYEGMANIMTAHANKICSYVNGKDKLAAD